MPDSSYRLVSAGYDKIAETYLQRHAVSSVRTRWFRELVALLPRSGARVLDLGCGAGIPVAQDLVALGHQVIGVDGSERQIALARAAVPAGEFLHADMMSIDLPPSSLDAVAAFYSIIHVPREDHGRLLGRIHDWLKPGGVLVASLGATKPGDWTGNWIGTEMFFSHHGAEANLVLLREAGFLMRNAEIVQQDNDDVSFLWVVAIKPFLR